MDTTTDTRRFDLDWLRVFVILMLIPFHAAVMFDVGSEFFVKNNEFSAILAHYTDFFGAWGMQLLFFVAGASAWFMLRKYSLKQFFSRRLLRLFVPLIAATLTIVPLMAYYGYRFNAGGDADFLRFYPKFFSFDINDVAGYAGHFTPGHLWFVLFLFVLTLIAMPIFVWFRSERGARVLSRITSFLAKPGAWLLVPVVLNFTDGAPELADRNFVGFFVFLLLGFIWMSDPRLQERADRQKYFRLVVAVLFGIVWNMLQRWGELQAGPSLGATAFDLLHDSYTWVVILALMGTAHSFLDRPTRAISYLGPASYPIYIIHLPVVVAIGYYAVQWPVSLTWKFILITAGSFIGIGLAYDLLIRRVPTIGRLFGAK